MLYSADGSSREVSHSSFCTHSRPRRRTVEAILRIARVHCHDYCWYPVELLAAVLLTALLFSALAHYITKRLDPTCSGHASNRGDEKRRRLRERRRKAATSSDREQKRRREKTIDGDGRKQRRPVNQKRHAFLMPVTRRGRERNAQRCPVRSYRQTRGTIALGSLPAQPFRSSPQTFGVAREQAARPRTRFEALS